MFARIADWFGRTTAPIRLTDHLDDLRRERDDRRLGTTTYDAARLLADHPPRIEHPNKQLLLDLAAHGFTGELTVERYGGLALPRRYTPVIPDLEPATSTTSPPTGTTG